MKTAEIRVFRAPGGETLAASLPQLCSFSDLQTLRVSLADYLIAILYTCYRGSHYEWLLTYENHALVGTSCRRVADCDHHYCQEGRQANDELWKLLSKKEFLQAQPAGIWGLLRLLLPA